MNVQEEYVLPAFFLKVISGSLKTKTRISIVAQSFGYSSAQPLLMSILVELKMVTNT